MLNGLTLIFRALLFIGALFLTCQLLACESISLVSSNSHYAMVHRIEAALFQHAHMNKAVKHFLVEKTTAITYRETLSKSCLVVTVGSEALNAVLQNDVRAPILSVLTRKSVFEYILRRHERSLKDKSAPMAVIYLDQPLHRQFNLVSVLFSERPTPKIGILLSNGLVDEKEALQTLAMQRQLPLTTVFVKKFENPVALLDSILNEVDVVVALPDQRIYNSATARGILLSAFHKRVPIVAYSHSFVNNGALASVYSNTKHVGDQTANTILAILRKSIDGISREQYPNDFAIAINYQVAKSVGLDLDNQEIIKLTMEEFESSQNKVKS